MHPICRVDFCARSVAYCEYAASRARRLLAAGAPGHRIPRGGFRPRSYAIVVAMLEATKWPAKVAAPDSKGLLEVGRSEGKDRESAGLILALGIAWLVYTRLY